MPHIDPEHLALLALGDDSARSDDVGHLAGCDRCREELNSLRRTVDLARTDDAVERPLPPPPARVWDAIAAQVQEDRERDLAPARSAPPLTETARPAAVPAEPAGAEPARVGEPDGAAARVLPFDAEHRRSRLRAWLLVAACVVGVIAGVAIGAAVRWPGQSLAPEPSEQVVASTNLAPLAGTPSSADGRAEVVRVDDRLQLRVDARNLQLRDGFYEVWMFDPQTNKMQPMGSLDLGHQTSFAIPDGMDIVKFAGIDVSAEPFDGNPEHSAESVLRGTLSR